jgi:uncharacterized protein (AIM24 family)
MTSILKVDTIQDTAGNNIINESGDTITIGASGDTITIPSGATTTLTDGVSGDFKMNSGFGSIATAYGCRAWVNFDGTGTPAIRESGNVTSITDNGTGLYTVNFTTAMPDTNYAVSCSGSRDDTSNIGMALVNTRSGTASYNPYATTSIAISSLFAHTSAVDTDFITVTIFR